MDAKTFVVNCPFCGEGIPFILVYSNMAGATEHIPAMVKCPKCGQEIQVLLAEDL